MESFRIENKYKVEVAKLDQLYKFLGDNSAKTLYPKRLIRSIYFDDQNYSLYKDSIEGIVPRKKIRIRTYSDFDILDPKIKFNLEVKINSVEGRFKSVKNDVNHIKLLKEGIVDDYYGLIFPVLEASYLREYYQIFNLRVTLDTKINYKIFKNKSSQILDEKCVLEVKSNNPDNRNYIDENFNFMKIRYSKYCNAIEGLNIV